MSIPGRRKPYTARGIARVPCMRCGAPSEHQWRICATGLWHPVCIACDLLINRTVAELMLPDHARELIESYRVRVGACVTPEAQT